MLRRSPILPVMPWLRVSATMSPATRPPLTSAVNGRVRRGRLVLGLAGPKGQDNPRKPPGRDFKQSPKTLLIGVYARYRRALLKSACMLSAD